MEKTVQFSLSGSNGLKQISVRWTVRFFSGSSAVKLRTFVWRSSTRVKNPKSNAGPNVYSLSGAGGDKYVRVLNDWSSGTIMICVVR